jgi:hypothetical protein
MKKIKNLGFKLSVLFTGSLLGIIMLFGLTFYLFGCRHYPKPNIPYSLEFYDKNVKNFPYTNE